ncbi:hypothetical protein PM082_002391 [Marasmius tenuissimus]|nr:hypothetical protein PM082_002391 [Marasmius tenuissimus]
MNTGVQNYQSSSGLQNNNNAAGTQNISFVNSFNTTASDPLTALWGTIAGVGASHNAEQQYERGECLPGTREEVIRIIWEWILSNGGEFPICWLAGTAGVGKTAIAITIAKECERKGRLVTSFFFFRSDPRRNNPSALVLTIAHGLAVTNPPCRILIDQRILDNPKILEAQMEDQFRELVMKPYERQTLPPSQKLSPSLRQTPPPCQTPPPPPPPKPPFLRQTKPHGSQTLSTPQKLPAHQTPPPPPPPKPPSLCQTKPHESQTLSPPRKLSLRQTLSPRQTKPLGGQTPPLPQKTLRTSSYQKKPGYTRKPVGEHSLTEMEAPNLVIIDGLDECGDEPTQQRVLSMIQSAFHSSPHLPLRFLICSRPEAWLQEAFADNHLSKLSKCIFLNDEFRPAEDIMKYYRHQFKEIVSNPKYKQVRFPNPWPTEKVLKTLVDKSCSQFVYAATVSRFISHADGHPIDQLRLILASNQSGASPYEALDTLYNIILKANHNPDKVHTILAAVVVLTDFSYVEPTPAIIELLLGLPSGQVALTLRGMHSVLNIGDQNDVITVHHTSFGEYLVDQNRSRHFHIDINTQKYVLARQWLQNLTTSKVRAYSPSQLYSDGTEAFFSGWIQFCTLISKPSRDLLDDLWNVNLAFTHLRTTFAWHITFQKLVPWVRQYDGPRICEVKDKKKAAENHSKVGENARLKTNSYTPYDNGQCEVEAHNCETAEEDKGLDLVEHLVHRFQNRPGCSHLVCPLGVTPQKGVVYWLVCRATGCPWKIYQVHSEPSDVDNVHLTDCRCDLPGGSESSNPEHLAYREACRQLVKAYVSLFEELAQSGVEDEDTIDDLEDCFLNMVCSSLLKHCCLDQELLLLCQMFFGLAKGCLVMRFHPGYGKEGRKNMLGWIETFPADSFAEEGKSLKAQVRALPWKRWAQNYHLAYERDSAFEWDSDNSDDAHKS